MSGCVLTRIHVVFHKQLPHHLSSDASSNVRSLLAKILIGVSEDDQTPEQAIENESNKSAIGGYMWT